MGRPPLGDRAMSGTERARRSRARHRPPAPAPAEPPRTDAAGTELQAVCRRCLAAYENLISNPRYVEFIQHPDRGADAVSSERHTEARAAFAELKYLLRGPR
jgi:hypothetical protein